MDPEKKTKGEEEAKKRARIKLTCKNVKSIERG